MVEAGTYATPKSVSFTRPAWATMMLAGFTARWTMGGVRVRDAEIGGLHAPGVVDHDVGRLHVAVHDVVLLRHVERVGHLRYDVRDGGEGEARGGLEDLEQRVALQELHRDVRDAVLFADVVDGDDVGM